MAPPMTPFSIIGATFGLFERKNKIHFLMLAVLMSFFSLIELAIVSLIVPFISALQNNAEVLQQFKLVDLPVDTENPFKVVRFMAFTLFILFTLKAFLDWFIHYDMCRLTQKIKRNLTLKLYKGYLNLKYVDYLQFNTNTFTKNCIVNTMHVVFYIHKSSEIIRDSLLILVLVFALLKQNILISLSIISTLALIGFIFFKLMQARLYRAGKSLDSANQKLQQWVNQSFLSIKEIKINNSIGYYQNHLEKSVDEYTNANITLAVLPRIPKVVLEYLVFTVIVAGALIVAITERPVADLIPVLVFYAVVTRRLIPLLNNLVGGHLELTGALALIQTLKNELNSTRKNQQAENDDIHNFQKEILLCDIDFRYYANDITLDKINLQINKGDYIAIVGKTGSGKSTLIELIGGLLDPEAGHFIADGVKIFSTKGLQHDMGYVPQQVYLIDESILTNITLKHEKELTSAERKWIRKLNQICQINEFSDKLEKGIASRVGESGNQLSGGQIQRIGIARQLFKRPKILILDEATSALDDKIESKILESLKKNLPELTVIMVTHKIRLLKKFDQLILLDKGNIAWKGHPDTVSMNTLESIRAVVDSREPQDQL